jgi:DNA invertase Pin-like site-specific DNA recombinase
MANVGYARVSTTDQDPQLQLDALKDAGCTRIFTDKASGAKAERPQLAKALERLEAGDTLVVWKLDRLGRNLGHLIDTVAGLDKLGVQFKSLTEGFDTTTNGGRLIFHIFGAIAEFERDLIRERTRAGLAAAALRPRKGGQPHRISGAKLDMVERMWGEHSPDEIAEALGVSRATIYRAHARAQREDR